MKLKNITIGISISEPDETELGGLGFGLLHVQDAMVETARQILNNGYNLAYGGDLTYSGIFNFTELLFQLGMTYGGITERIVNYSAFPLYTKISKRREAELINVAKIIRVNPSNHFDKWLKLRYDDASSTDRTFLDSVFDCKTDEAKQIWAESLTEMRRQMTKKIQCRIVMGGKTQNYKGIMPGIMEETLMCFKNKIPVLIDGRLGGAAKQIVDEVLNRRPTIETIVPAEFRNVREFDFKKITDDTILLKGNNDVKELENLVNIL